MFNCWKTTNVSKRSLETSGKKFNFRLQKKYYVIEWKIKEATLSSRESCLFLASERSKLLQTLKLTHLFPMHPFSTLQKGIEKGCIGSKWVNNPTCYRVRLIFLKSCRENVFFRNLMLYFSQSVKTNLLSKTTVSQYQPAHFCSNSAISIVEKSAKYVQS